MPAQSQDRREYMREYNKAHRAELNAKARERYRRNLEHSREYGREYRQKNRDKLREGNNQRYQTRYKDRAKQYYEEHREDILEKRKKHYDKQKIGVLLGEAPKQAEKKPRPELSREPRVIGPEEMERAKKRFRDGAYVKEDIGAVMAQLEKELESLFSERRERSKATAMIG